MVLTRRCRAGSYWDAWWLMTQRYTCANSRSAITLPICDASLTQLHAVGKVNASGAMSFSERRGRDILHDHGLEHSEDRGTRSRLVVQRQLAGSGAVDEMVVEQHLRVKAHLLVCHALRHVDVRRLDDGVDSKRPNTQCNAQSAAAAAYVQRRGLARMARRGLSGAHYWTLIVDFEGAGLAHFRRHHVVVFCKAQRYCFINCSQRHAYLPCPSIPSQPPRSGRADEECQRTWLRLTS